MVSSLPFVPNALNILDSIAYNLLTVSQLFELVL